MLRGELADIEQALTRLNQLGQELVVGNYRERTGRLFYFARGTCENTFKQMREMGTETTKYESEYQRILSSVDLSRLGETATTPSEQRQKPSQLEVGGREPKKEDFDFSEMRTPSSGRCLSEEETKKRMEEIVMRKITPELLNYFTEREIYDLIRTFYDSPSASYADTHRVDSLEAKKFLAKEVKGKRVIELGTNVDERYKNLFKNLGAESYEGVDPKFNLDGLTALVRRPDESAIVCSVALFADGVLYPNTCDVEDTSIFRRYREELLRQMYRVTPRGGITFHGLEDWCLRDFRNAGFVLEESVPEELKPSLQKGEFKLCALRKK